MIKRSIKAKILLFYTVFFGILIALNILFIVSLSESSLVNEATQKIVEITQHAAYDIEIEDDGIKMDADEDDFEFYEDGVLFLIYDEQTIVYGNPPALFDTTLPFTFSEPLREHNDQIDWLYYDIALDSQYVVRGLYNITNIDRSVTQVINTLLILSPILVLFSLGGGYLIIRRNFKPLKSIYHTAEDIEQSKDFSKRVEGVSNPKDEFGKLTKMINQMLDQIEISINREKSFSSNVSHELRTPLAVMRAQLELTLEKAGKSPLTSDLNVLMQQLFHLESIVTQLLELARMRVLTKDDLEPIDLYDTALYVGESMSHMMTKKNLTFFVIKPDFDPIISANQVMMVRLFTNLIQNAIKYNVEQGRIEILFTKTANEIHIDVKDTGIGIEETHLNDVFNPFYQVDSSRFNVDKSIGLGLSFVKEIVLLHQGSVSVKSIKGQGTTFHLIFPLS
jgi:signal transduction histidine kinase